MEVFRQNRLGSLGPHSQFRKAVVSSYFCVMGFPKPKAHLSFFFSGQGVPQAVALPWNTTPYGYGTPGPPNSWPANRDSFSMEGLGCSLISWNTSTLETASLP